ncbi:hypothetical protein [Epibacterium ulvae]|uniref:hypothetical protein n=1 Tax=Epibacterium ulvae TaxID=1156985 RepID=UPI0024936167|nr:hypothetical protein [Epibacterium ulvae]
MTSFKAKFEPIKHFSDFVGLHVRFLFCVLGIYAGALPLLSNILTAIENGREIETRWFSLTGELSGYTIEVSWISFETAAIFLFSILALILVYGIISSIAAFLNSTKLWRAPKLLLIVFISLFEVVGLLSLTFRGFIQFAVPALGPRDFVVCAFNHKFGMHNRGVGQPLPNCPNFSLVTGSLPFSENSKLVFFGPVYSQSGRDRFDIMLEYTGRDKDVVANFPEHNCTAVWSPIKTSPGQIVYTQKGCNLYDYVLVESSEASRIKLSFLE